MGSMMGEREVLVERYEPPSAGSVPSSRPMRRRTEVRAALRRQRARAGQGAAAGWQWLERQYWPGARGTAVITAGVLLVALILAGAIVIVHFDWWSRLNTACKNNDLGCHVGSHLVVDPVLAGIAYWLFLRREAAAGRSWRKTVRQEPERLFLDWLPNPDGLTGAAARAATGTLDRPITAKRTTGDDSLPPIAGTAIGRDHLVAAITDDLNQTGDPQVLVGDSGTGKTTVLMLLARHLASQGQVPVAITLHGHSASKVEDDAKAMFISTVMSAGDRSGKAFRRARARDHEQAEKWWNWLRRRSLITVLADDLEKSVETPAARVQALDRATHENLRLVVASRAYGLPPDYRRGRTEIDRLDRAAVCDNLKTIASSARSAHRDAPSDKEIEGFVEDADIGRTPYYLAIARVLAQRGLFPELGHVRDPRVALLDTYREGVANGVVAPAAGLSPETRAKVLYQLEAVAFVRILEIREEDEIARTAEAYQPAPPGMRWAEVFDLARRLMILDSRYDGEVHFAHPTTLAYFAARFVRSHRGHGDESWKKELADRPHLSAIVTMALILAVAGDEEMVQWGSDEVLRRLKVPQPDRPSEESDEVKQERLELCVAAAEMLSTLTKPHPEVVNRVAKVGRSQSVVGGKLIAEKKRVLNALARLDAYDEVWLYARDRLEYPVRREATRILVRATNAHDAVIAKLTDVIDSAEAESRETPQHADDNVEVIDQLKPVAWMLPSLRQSASSTAARQRELDDLQDRLIALSLANALTVQRGLEASVAQGFKLAARWHLGHADRFVDDMLEQREQPPRFWFSRVMLVQALAFQCFSDPGVNRRPDGDRRAIRERLVARSRDDPHPFVRETARLCRLAVDKGRWERYIWADTTEIVTRIPQELSVEAAQLVGDIVIALNLTAHHGKAVRHRFGEADALPACLGPGGSRDWILGRKLPDRCVLDVRGDGEDERDGRARCACPYMYNSTDLKIDPRRELSRAFCRHQRTNARPLRWQADLELDALKKFWEGMETLARF